MYMSQSRENRVIVNKLAAILRVADALTRGNNRRAEDIRFLHQGDELIVGLPGVGDILLEERSITAKGGLFEEVYGMKIRLEEA